MCLQYGYCAFDDVYCSLIQHVNPQPFLKMYFQYIFIVRDISNKRYIKMNL